MQEPRWTLDGLKGFLGAPNDRDHEEAHGEEDELLWLFVRAIADGKIAGDDAPLLAHLLVEWDKKYEDRTRWYA